MAVIDRTDIAAEQSSRAWGFIRQQGRHPAEIPLANRAMSLWNEITDEFGFESTRLVKKGILVPAQTQADKEFIHNGYDTAKAYGLNVDVINTNELKTILPELSGNWLGALYSPNDGHGDPKLSTLTIANAARKMGVKFFIGEPITKFIPSSDNITGVQTATQSFKSDSILVAAGIGSKKLVTQLGLNFPIQTIRSSVTQTTSNKPFTNIAVWAPSVAFRPHANGSFTLGNGYRGQGTDYDITLESVQNLRYFFPAFRLNWRLLRLAIGNDLWRSVADLFYRDRKFDSLAEPPINFRKIDANLDAFQSLFPQLDTLSHAKSWAGRLDITPDLIPIIDRPLDYQNIFVACGFSGHGFALGPSIGQQISQWIMDGSPEIDLNKFRYSRFVDGSLEYVKAL